MTGTESTDRTRQIGVNAVQAAKASDVSADHAVAQQLVQMILNTGEVVRVRLLDHSGKVVVDTHPAASASDREVEIALQPGLGGGRLALEPRPPRIDEVLLTPGAAIILLILGLALTYRWRERLLQRRRTATLEGLDAELRDLISDASFADRLNNRFSPTGEPVIDRLADALNSLLLRFADHDGRRRARVSELIEARSLAEEANRQKSDFLAKVSHEIRTPMNGVLAMAEVMEQNDLGSAQRERLAVIRQSGEAVMELLNDVLDLARIEAGRLTLEAQPFFPSKIAEDAVACFRAVAATKGLMLQLRATPEADAPRIGDATRVRQIIINLISNSLKFTSAGRVKIVVSATDGDLHLSVTDTGIGIPQDQVNLLFEKFGASTAPVAGSVSGTGLGLAICKDICSLMGGRIWVEADRTHGAAFHVVLPLKLADAADLDRPSTAHAASPALVEARSPAPVTGPGGAEQEPEPDTRALRILAAEDNTTNRLVLEAVIGILGYNMDMVVDGREAVSAWELADYDVILMDIQMPVLDGIAATREIRDRERATGRLRTPIIAVSANVMTHQVAEYMAAGMDGHVPKPIDLTRLHNAIIAAIESPPQVEFSPENGSSAQFGRPG